MTAAVRVCLPAIPSKGGVALTLPAALQGFARVFGSSFLSSAGLSIPSAPLR